MHLNAKSQFMIFRAWGFRWLVFIVPTRFACNAHWPCRRLPRGFDSDWEGGEQMSAMVSMRGLQPRDLMPVGGVAVTRDTVNHWLLDSMCCDGYHVPRSYNCLQPLCVPAAFPRRLLPGATQSVRNARLKHTL